MWKNMWENMLMSFSSGESESSWRAGGTKRTHTSDLTAGSSPSPSYTQTSGCTALMGLQAVMWPNVRRIAISISGQRQDKYRTNTLMSCAPRWTQMHRVLI